MQLVAAAKNANRNAAAGGAREATPLLNGWRGRLLADRIKALLDRR